MTDQPSIEQQLADVIERRCGLHPGAAIEDAAAIIAAVNEGRCDPIVPEGAQVILPGVTYALGDPAELAELRALKAKVDSAPIGEGYYGLLGFAGQRQGWNDCLAWLREQEQCECGHDWSMHGHDDNAQGCAECSCGHYREIERTGGQR